MSDPHPWIAASEHQRLMELSLEARLTGGDEFVGDRWREVPASEVILPGREFDTIGYDPVDWAGVSLEFHGYIGEPPTVQERERLFLLGFSVIRIDYQDPERWTAQHKFHGDWSCVRGHEPRTGKPCRVGSLSEHGPRIIWPTISATTRLPQSVIDELTPP